MLSKYKLAGIAAWLSLTGCSATMMGANLVPERDQVTPLEQAPTVTYQLPQPITGIDQLGLTPYERFRVTEMTHRALGIGVDYDSEPSHLTVTAYENNVSSGGLRLAGSYNTYHVAYHIDGETVTLTPMEHRTHQDGLLLPIPVPDFTIRDVTSFLSTIKGEMNVTVDSPYPSEAVNANFRRLMEREAPGRFRSGGDERTFRNVYFTEVEGAEVRLQVEVYPYRDGTQANVDVNYYTRGDGSEPIVIEEIERRIEDTITAVVNA